MAATAAAASPPFILKKRFRKKVQLVGVGNECPLKE
jgi:hypothetical protein